MKLSHQIPASGNRAASKCHEAMGFLSWVGAKIFAGCKGARGGCSTAAQPCTALPAAQQRGGCSAKKGLFPLQLRCFPPPLFSRLCMGAVLGRGSERQREEPREGQAAAPRLKHRSASGSPCPCKGKWGPRMGEMGKALSACAGEGHSKERRLKGLCLSWAAFARLSQSRHPLPSAHCFRLLGAWVPAQAQGAEEWGKPLPLPSLRQPALVLLPLVGCCLLSRPGWRAMPGD